MEKEILEKLLLSRYLKLDGNREILFRIIPELKETYGFNQKHPHHCYDVWEHTIEALKRSKPDLQIRIALLLHDIGKPHCYQEDKNIRHFRGHPEKSAEISEKILKRLKYSDEEIESICYLIKNHDTLIDINKITKNNIELVKKQLYIQYCDAYAHAPQYIDRRIEKLDKVYEQIKEIITIEEER